MANKKDYHYQRPPEGQIEERWFASLSDAEKRRVEEDTNHGLRQRTTAWNISHDPTRQFPRL